MTDAMNLVLKVLLATCLAEFCCVSGDEILDKILANGDRISGRMSGYTDAYSSSFSDDRPVETVTGVKEFDPKSVSLGYSSSDLKPIDTHEFAQLSIDQIQMPLPNIGGGLQEIKDLRSEGTIPEVAVYNTKGRSQHQSSAKNNELRVRPVAVASSQESSIKPATITRPAAVTIKSDIEIIHDYVDCMSRLTDIQRSSIGSPGLVATMKDTFERAKSSLYWYNSMGARPSYSPFAMKAFSRYTQLCENKRSHRFSGQKSVM